MILKWFNKETMYTEVFHFPIDDTASAWHNDTYMLRQHLKQLRWTQHMLPEWQIWINKVEDYIHIYQGINVPGDIRYAYNTYRALSANEEPFPFPNPWDEEQRELILEAQHPNFNNQSLAIKLQWIEKVKYMFYVFGMRAVPRFLRDTVRSIQEQTLQEPPFPFIDKLMNFIIDFYDDYIATSDGLYPKFSWICLVNQYFQLYGGDTIPIDVKETYNRLQTNYFQMPPFDFQD